ncbi:hypothetical protein GPALN_013105 [Globodera pallida]|nr:hypothetical protein GPALN_013105 [Globodera pallida]
MEAIIMAYENMPGQERAFQWHGPRAGNRFVHQLLSLLLQLVQRSSQVGQDMEQLQELELELKRLQKLELERLQEVELELEPKVEQDLELKRMVMVLLKANISSAWDIRMLTTRTATISADNDDGGGDDDGGGGGGD